MLVVDELVPVGLVDSLKYFAADFRQDADFDILVFEIDDLVFLLSLLGGQIIVDGIRIDSLLRALRTASEIELRVGIRRTDEIGRDGDLVFPYLDRGIRGKQQGTHQQSE